MKIRVAVFFGGKSVEHEVSVISAIQAMNSINEDKYDILPIYMTKAGGEFYTGDLMRDVKSFTDLPLLLKKSRKVNFVSDGGRVYMVDAFPGTFGKKTRV